MIQASAAAFKLFDLELVSSLGVKLQSFVTCMCVVFILLEFHDLFNLHSLAQHPPQNIKLRKTPDKGAFGYPPPPYRLFSIVLCARRCSQRPYPRNTT